MHRARLRTRDARYGRAGLFLAPVSADLTSFQIWYNIVPQKVYINPSCRRWKGLLQSCFLILDCAALCKCWIHKEAQASRGTAAPSHYYVMAKGE